MHGLTIRPGSEHALFGKRDEHLAAVPPGEFQSCRLGRVQVNRRCASAELAQFARFIFQQTAGYP